MFAAGGMFFLNMQDCGVYDEERVELIDCWSPTTWHPFSSRYCGWPQVWHGRDNKVSDMYIQWTPLAIDAAIGIALLLAVAVAIEIILRLAGHKPTDIS